MTSHEEESYYYFTLADFADLVKVLGGKKVLEDLYKYQNEAYNIIHEVLNDY